MTVARVITFNSHWEPIKRGRFLFPEGRRREFIRSGDASSVGTSLHGNCPWRRPGDLQPSGGAQPRLRRREDLLELPWRLSWSRLGSSGTSGERKNERTSGAGTFRVSSRRGGGRSVTMAMAPPRGCWSFSSSARCGLQGRPGTFGRPALDLTRGRLP